MQHQDNHVEIKNQADWDSLVLKNAKPVIVDFYADWCPPCKKLKPILEQQAATNNGKFVLAVVNVDLPEVGGISGTYAAQGIPSVYLFKGGKQDDHFLGYDQKGVDRLVAKAIA